MIYITLIMEIDYIMMEMMKFNNINNNGGM